MINDDSRNQMTLFNVPAQPVEEIITAQTTPEKTSHGKSTTSKKKTATAGRAARKPAKPAPVKNISGQVPEGDVRLTANIREDLHLKLKIAAARRRTTIGELIEEFIATYL